MFLTNQIALYEVIYFTYYTSQFTYHTAEWLLLHPLYLGELQRNFKGKYDAWSIMTSSRWRLLFLTKQLYCRSLEKDSIHALTLGS